MAHKSRLTSIRLGKGLLWQYNTNPHLNNLVPVTSRTSQGLKGSLKILLRRRRLFIIKNNITYNFYKNEINLYVLYMPRIKTLPRRLKLQINRHRVLYSNGLSLRRNIFSKLKSFALGRLEHNYEFTRRKRLKRRLNRWLTKRMMRGVSSSFYYTKRATYRRLKQQKILKYKTIYLVRGFKKSFRISKHSKNLQRYPNRRERWPGRWFLKPAAQNYKNLSNNYFSRVLSKANNYKINVKLLNVFVYFGLKKYLNFKNHQKHLWHRRYRSKRFSYSNYYDIVNSFFLFAIIKGSENVLFDILHTVMPRIFKIRKFMFFLDSVIKHMPQVRKGFVCVRILLTGKIKGGTKRTNSMVIGYGTLPFNSVSSESSNLFTYYTHKYGAFGVKLIYERGKRKTIFVDGDKRYKVVKSISLRGKI